jgi:hypothetical protein
MVGVAYGSSPPPSDVSVRGAKVSFVTLSETVNTIEATITLPVGVLSYQLRATGSQELTISNSLLGTAAVATSVTIPKHNTWEEDGLNLDVALNIYIKSSQVGTIVEIIYWL